MFEKKFLVGQYLELESLRLLPGEDIASEMAVAGGLLEDGVLQLEVLHDAARPEILYFKNIRNHLLTVIIKRHLTIFNGKTRSFSLLLINCGILT